MKRREYYEGSSLFYTDKPVTYKIMQAILWMIAFPIMATIQLNKEPVVDQERKGKALLWVWAVYVMLYIILLTMISSALTQ